MRALIEKKAPPPASHGLARLAQAAAALGCSAILARHLRVLQRLSEYGFFRAGGVLVGTHAFLAFGNMLGVRWTEGSRTHDVDLAHADKRLEIALPSDVHVDTNTAIDSLDMGFLPVSSLTATEAGATTLDPREPQFRLDFLTPLHRGGDRPFKHPQLGVKLQPLKFMEFSLENVQQAALFSADRVVLVNVPDPARFALHKLLVYGERSGTLAAKSSKDLVQAGLLLSPLKEHRASEVEEAWKDLLSRGKGWVRQARQGVGALAKAYPELRAKHWLTTQS